MVAPGVWQERVLELVELEQRQPVSVGTWTPPVSGPDEPAHVWIQGIFAPRIVRDDRPGRQVDEAIGPVRHPDSLG